jgi:ABC-type cobalamin/Fe3+-siderophores transport system ATPase subunit
MKLKTVELKKFKRFTHLTITDIPESAKLIVLLGPNGCGKTSLFEAFKQWSGRYGGTNFDQDISYIAKDSPNFNNEWTNNIIITFHSTIAADQASKRRAFYIRSAYRNEADFNISGLSRVGAAIDTPRIRRLIDNDASVSDNYQRIVSHSVEKLYSGEFDTNNVKELRETLIGEIRKSTIRIFDDLILTGPGDPLRNGAFYFKKGIVNDFHFKNLSGGEKSAFDIILDIITKKIEFNDTVYCIDEPDLHLHTKLQGLLLEEIYNLIPDNCQLVISTHSIGMIRKAVDMQRQHSDKIIFFDFHDKNLDEDIVLKPVTVTRELWKKTLQIALDDLSELVSPKQIVICEGKPASPNGTNKEFDARCLRTIFNSEYSDTEFISVGNHHAVTTDKIDIITTLKTLNSGIEFIKIIDRDDRSENEIKELKMQGIKVLTQRDIESYLLDDEIIEKLCKVSGQESLIADCLQIKKTALTNSIARKNPTDDIKSAAGEIYVELKKILSLTACGNSTESFLSDTIAPLITPDTKIYLKLKEEIFGTV